MATKLEVPEKPKTQKEQIAQLWEFTTNHIWHRLNWQDTKLNFMITILGIMLALQAVILVAK